METFDWHFNAATIKRALIEELASCAFVRRHENIIVVGQSGLGKSHIFRGIGRCACVHGFRTCYITSAKLIRDLKKTLADDTLTTRLRYWTNFDLLIIDEFGFDRLERQLCSEAPQLLYKVIEGRYAQRSTIIVTNVDFEAWGDYLGNAPLAMAFLDRLVDGANVLKLRGRSYRAVRQESGMRQGTGQVSQGVTPAHLLTALIGNLASYRPSMPATLQLTHLKPQPTPWPMAVKELAQFWMQDDSLPAPQSRSRLRPQTFNRSSLRQGS